jgi:23S rRNA pseudouridine2605 synthase
MTNKNETIRINKFLANLGIASRRKIDEMIEGGKISVNNQLAKPGDKVNPQKDKIVVNGKNLEIPKDKNYTYIILNKPKGYISTTSDTHDRQTILNLINSYERLYPVGRLDQDSQGLILLTNDGDLAYKLTHPKFHVSKTYEVTLLGNTKKSKLDQLRSGVKLEEGLTQPTKVKILSQTNNETIIEIVLFEGKKRQIRRMCAALHLFVIELKRVKLGPIKLGKLEEGHFRHLNSQETKDLKAVANAKKNIS